MIIGIDASRANLLHKTGTEWYSFYLIKNLAEIDKVNTYWLYLNQPAQPELAETVKNNSNFSFKLLKWPFFSFWTLGRLTLEMLYHRPDVLFIPAHTLPLFGPRRTVNTIHDIAFVREQNLYRAVKAKTSIVGTRQLINFFVRLLTLGRYRSDSVDYLYWSTAFALHHAQKIIAVSEFTKQDILNLYPKTPASKVAVVHNGYNDKLYRRLPENPEKTAAVLDKYGLEAPYFLYIGRLEKKKNIPALVEAFAYLRENHSDMKAKLVLIGDAGFGFDEIKYTIEEFNLNNQVTMPGWVAEEDMPYVMNAAAAFIFPSKHEGFGIPVLQSLACGIPTAVSDIPVLREVAGDAALYFDQNDKRAIAEAMGRILSDNELRESLILKGLEQAKKFSWRRCAEETLEVITSL
ncbi:MAG: glycosyltransferase family 1 protein [Patescibacteria group bacterium]|jgi:glycosyltransferase involved in cell wall biosynthesis